jgi:hypothetical protein
MMHRKLPGAECVEGTQDAELALVIGSEVTKRGEKNLHGVTFGYDAGKANGTTGRVKPRKTRKVCRLGKGGDL